MRAVLMYHSIDSSGSPVSIDEGAFDRHVRWLTSGAVKVVPVEDILRAEDDSVALTFDDAFGNFADVAWPRLREHGLPVTVYVVSDHAGRTNRWGDADAPGIPELPLLDWEALGRLADEGVSLGCHSRTHPVLPRLDENAIEDEVAGALREIHSRTGVEARTFAYPYGEHDATSRRVAARHFEVSCTTELRILRDDTREDPHRVPRLDAWYYRRAGALERWGTRGFRTHVKVRSWARTIRRRLKGSPR